MGGGTTAGGGLALSVHGPRGVVDLVVPAGASAADVALEYALQSGLGAGAGPPARLFDRLGTPLSPGTALADAGVRTGDLLVATTVEVEAEARPTAGRPLAVEPGPPGRLATLWCCVAVAVAALAGWFAAAAGTGTPREAAVVLLVVAAAVGVLPLGRLATHRAVTAPVFGGAAAFAAAWDPHPERLPTVLGVAALVAAVVAAVARALDPRSEEALRAWVLVGAGCFVVTGAAALLGLAPQVAWAVLLLAALLAARFVPGFAVDVPDHLLLDLDRLAVTAWSARDRPTGRRGRAVVPEAAVAAVAAHGARVVTAYAAAVLAVAGVAAPLLLATADLPIDRVGARLLVLFCGGGLLLAARSYRHAAARVLLVAAGLLCWGALAVAVLPDVSGRTATVLALASIGVALGLVVVAVATGRGWRSAWWARRAEVAEALCGSAAVATLLVAAGAFRSLWESVHLDV